MASVNFTAYPSGDCTSLNVTDLTGRQPDSADGYGATADISTYTGELCIFNSAGVEVIADIPVTPATTGIAQVVTIADYGSLPDGIYRTVYTVRDSVGVSIGSAEAVLVIDCSFDCTMASVIANILTCDCGGNSIDSATRARQYRGLALVLSQSGDMVGANDMFVSAQEFLDHANCNCK